MIMVPAAALTFGTPVAFGSVAGFFHAAPGRMGVLMLSPWGFEEMTVRRGWATLAVGLAEAGLPCLRFDWPGTGDSLGNALDIETLDIWRAAVREAATYLRETTGIDRLCVLGQGLGALLAIESEREINADALVVMAPAREGRAGVRELTAWSAILASFLRIETEFAGAAVNVMGFTLSRPFTETLTALTLDRAPRADAPPALLLARADRAGDDDIAEALLSRGHALTRMPYEHYARFVAHQSTSEVPAEDFARIITYLKALGGAEARSTAPASALTSDLAGPDFDERSLPFGTEGRLHGILCTPKGQPSRAVVVLVNSGYNTHTGWARMHVTIARALAARGIASYRIDCSGIGDSPLPPGVSSQLLYTEDQIADVRAALDAIAPLGLGPAMLSGRCSGAYASLQACARDPRVSGVIAINTLRLILDPRETFEQIMAAGSSSLADYRKRALSWPVLRDLLTFRLPLLPIARRVGRKLAGMLIAKIVPYTGTLTLAGRLRQAVRDQAASFVARDVKIILLYAENDGGRDEVIRYFGPEPAGGYAHAEVRVVPGTEHNMTAPHAQAAILDAITDTAARLSP
jgi:alpha-beta hydrolase superfamily lysophospholipase